MTVSFSRIVIALVLSALGVLATMSARAEVSLVAPPVEMQAPDMRLPTLDGATFDLRARAGKVTVLNFWALWCAPCKVEMPALAALGQKLAGDGIDIVAVNLGDPLDRVRAFVERNRLDGLAIVLDDADAAKAWHVGALPVTYVVGPNGRIVYAALGPRKWQDDTIVQTLRSLNAAR